MEKSKAPAFQFYPKDFLAEENVAVMSLAERGAYITLICFCWHEGSLPNDMMRLGRMCGCSAEEMAEMWKMIGPCFQEEDGRLVHPRLERERSKQKAYRERKSAAGKKGAKARWDKEKDGTASGSANGSAKEVPMANDGPAVCSLQSPDSGQVSTEDKSSGPEPAVENSTEEETEPPTFGELMGTAREVCGLNRWTRDQQNRAGSVIRQWLKKGYEPRTILRAMKGARSMVDRGEVDWLEAEKPFGCRALNHVMNGGRDFFTQAAEWTPPDGEQPWGNVQVEVSERSA